MKQYKISLNFYGIEETETIEAENMEEAEKELVQWVLEQVDHWCEELPGETSL
ncbi:hypothetical protein SOV_04490 [Sporomusa ovata DSM 2662]|uniref:Uncharacterized protein n=1 Tax=Sporomusa ovata TaxID=2378 RepID=A0A0U1KWE4_9FIRM|nr:hypothetical protein [Sporomusa ovata]EQB28119.1 hypothetical protein SOV_2c10420 [Sporomusa ovata DSM 2662]CQR71656.1 hypothetical protein SpAn4DRAFT_3522 [Sporomusa ovata]